MSMGTKLVGDHLITGTKFLGTICLWELNCLGTICPEGPINWEPILGDQMSGDHMRLGPNVTQPIVYFPKTIDFLKISIFFQMLLTKKPYHFSPMNLALFSSKVEP